MAYRHGTYLVPAGATPRLIAEGARAVGAGQGRRSDGQHPRRPDHLRRSGRDVRAGRHQPRWTCTPSSTPSGFANVAERGDVPPLSAVKRTVCTASRHSCCARHLTAARDRRRRLLRPAGPRRPRCEPSARGTRTGSGLSLGRRQPRVHVHEALHRAYSYWNPPRAQTRTGRGPPWPPEPGCRSPPSGGSGGSSTRCSQSRSRELRFKPSAPARLPGHPHAARPQEC